MQLVSVPFTTASAASYRYPVPKIEAQWDGSNWTDETAYLTAFSFKQQVSRPGVEAPSAEDAIAKGSVTLRNVGYRFSPWHSGGDDSIRAYLTAGWGATGTPVRISMGFWCDTDSDGAYEEIQYCRIFTGYLYDPKESPAQATVTYEIRDRGWLLYQSRATTGPLVSYRLDALLSAFATAGGWPDALTTDTSPWTIPYAWLDDDSALREMQLAAHAVQGRIWTDANGAIRYEDASHWLGHSGVWTFDAGDLVELPPRINVEDYASKIVVEYNPRTLDAYDVVFSLDELKTIRPGATETYLWRLDTPALTITNPEAGTDYWFDSGAGAPINESCTITITAYAQQVRVSITNNHTVLAAYLRFFQLRGVAVVGGRTEQVENVIDADPDVPRVRSMRADFYTQTYSQAAAMAAMMAARQGALQPIFTVRSVPGVPQLELGDKITFSDSRAVSAARTGYILSIAQRFTMPRGDGDADAQEPVFAQDMEVLDDANLFPAGTYFVIGTTALGSGVAWY